MQHICGNEVDIKGKYGENLAYDLAKVAFLKQWCYQNPKLNNGKELCDLLIIFDDIMLIWSVKNVKLTDIYHDKDNNPIKTGTPFRIKEKHKDKSKSQLIGAYKQIFKHNAVIELPNYGVIDKTQFKKIFLCSVFIGDKEFCSPLLEKADDLLIHTVPEEDLNILVHELDTVTDFIDYFKFKESSLKNILVNGNEGNLLVTYINFKNNPNVDINNFDQIIIDDDIWEKWKQDNRYQHKKRADKISIIWDELIYRFSNDNDLSQPHNQLMLTQLAKPNRFLRRVLASSFSEIISQQPILLCRCLVSAQLSDVIYLFFNINLDLGHYKISDINSLLLTRARMALYEYPEFSKVIGIVRLENNRCYQYSFALISDIKQLTEEDYIRYRTEYSNYTNTTTNLSKSNVQEYENRNQ